MKVGILGGGQLAKMLALSGVKLGINFHFFVEQVAIAGLDQLGTIHVGPYQDFPALKAFAEQVDVITFETETIPLETVQYLGTCSTVFPDQHALKNTQDRLLEKELFTHLDIPTNRFMPVDQLADLAEVANQFGFPFILKKRMNGYDGKGQFKIDTPDDIGKLTDQDVKETIAEAFVPFDREVSLIAVRSQAREVLFYDLCENQHKNGILVKTVNQQDDPAFKRASSYVEKLLNHFNYTGVLALELFQVGDQLLANEMAPRVHNTGHWTIEGAVTSQFENHVRSILNLPLGDTRSVTQCKMVNLIGNMPSIRNLLSIQGLVLHDYLKEARPGRKLGHCNLIACDSDTQAEQALQALLSE